jgi:sugar transferase (PEP-CTERM/EpsH1 system associated)
MPALCARKRRLDVRLLFLTHRLPFPPDKGDKIRAYHFIRCLSARHDVDVAALADDPLDLDPERHLALRSVCRRLDVVWRSKTRARTAAALLALPQGNAASLPFFHSPRLARIVQDGIAARRYDAVLAHSAPMTSYVPATRGLVRVADLCDVDSEKWRQYAGSAPPFTRWLYAREAFLLRRHESSIAREWNAVAVASSHEAAIFRNFCKDGELAVVPNGVDGERFAPSGITRDDATVLFVGVMDYRPNVDGVLWFHREVWPLVRRAVPAARFRVVGPRPVDAIRALDDQARPGARTGTRVAGYVDDLQRELGTATLAVAPLHIARGVQNKVLEALAAGLPVVSTTAAWEGIAAQAGRDLLVADAAQPFADAIVRLLRSPVLCDTLGRAGRSAVLANHAWGAHAATLEALLAGEKADAA